MEQLIKLKKQAGEILFFPAKLVHCVIYYFFFLQMNKGTHGGSVGPTMLVQACTMLICIHLAFAICGLSYWELCMWLGKGFELDKRPNSSALGMYMIFYLIISWVNMNKVANDKTIQEMAFIHSTWQRKVISVILFFVFVLGIPTLTLFVAMSTVEPWY